MFKQSEQGNVVGFAIAGFCGQAEKDTGRGLRQRPSGRIVNRNVPTFQFVGNPARQIAVGGDKSSGFFRCFQSVAHDGGNCQRLFVQFAAADQMNTVCGFGRKRPTVKFAPTVGGGGGSHDFRNQFFAFGVVRRNQIGNLMTLQTQIVKQPFGFKLGVGLVDLLPGVIIQPTVETVQINRSVVKLTHGFYQLTDNGRAAGDAGNDYFSVEATVLPGAILHFQQFYPAFGGVDIAAFGEDFGKMFGDDG